MSAQARQKIVLTGIKPTGSPHLGNYLGAIKPALALSQAADHRCYYFIADYHALTSTPSKEEFRGLTLEVAATWLAFGLDPSKCVFYRQSDLPEIFELAWILSCVTPKGLMNRAHAYKAAVQENEEKKNPDLDAGVNMGLYGYPVLMAADILMFKSHLVPVGKDQVQHVEITRDIAGRFNQAYGETFRLPEAKIQEATAVLPGLDGRKMSKSYGNTIPLFEPAEKLRKLVMRIKTDSTPPEAPKDPATSYLFTLYREFATAEQTEAMRGRYAKGISWGEAKQALFDVLDAFLSGPRERYTKLMADPRQIETCLEDGARRARSEASAFVDEIRRKIGAGRRLGQA